MKFINGNYNGDMALKIATTAQGKVRIIGPVNQRGMSAPSENGYGLECA